MNESVKREVRFYSGAITLEAFFPRKIRKVILALSFTATIGLGFVCVLYIAEAWFRLDAFSPHVLLTGAGANFYGSFLISFTIFFLTSMLQFYFNAKYYRGIEPLMHEGQPTQKRGLTYEVAEVLLPHHKDLTTAFLTSRFGYEIIRRSGLSKEALQKFLTEKKEIIGVEQIQVPESGFLTLEHIAEHVYLRDDELQDLLSRSGVTESIYRGAIGWVVKRHHFIKHDTRWWSRDNLGKVPVLGREWSYGNAFMLERFSKPIATTTVFSVLSSDLAYAEEKVDEIESVLARAKDANALLVGDQGVGKMDIVMRLASRIGSGDSAPALLGKRLVVLDHEGFIAAHGDTHEFEAGIIQLFNQATTAGNIILVIDNLPNFLEGSAKVGVNLAPLIDVYLASPSLHVITTSDPVRFQSHIETKPSLIQRFERVQIASPDLSSSVRILQSIADRFEVKNKVMFTYGAIFAVAESADRYISDGVMPDKAVELLSEIAPTARREKIGVITKEFVNQYVSRKTGVPTGPVQEEEREMLLNLEEVLHERVIGQKAAIKAISGVMRRARAGVQDSDRPLGSFMFLGSTGVGKTETTKALAHVFFGGEDHMSRIDMSEYSGEDGLNRLIGDGKKVVGSLPLLLKEKPYGVLLLDEFEKANNHVHDLFLQIIDEGFFTDARGHKINARNNIIIATSNAGAKMIWEIAKAKKNPSTQKDAIIDSIIKEGIYKPELINRFDGVIVFEPLKLGEQEKIAKILLNKLKERIEKKGYNLVIDEVLISVVVQHGYDPEFGARPMRRVIQDEIEEKIASKIIAGNLQRGDKIWFFEEDFKE